MRGSRVRKPRSGSPDQSAGQVRQEQASRPPNLRWDTHVAVRLSDFWDRMRRVFGDAYAESLAHDHVMAGLHGRTVTQALADGDDAQRVWRAVCAEFAVPASER